METPVEVIAEAMRCHGMEISEVGVSSIRGLWNERPAHIFVYRKPQDSDALFLFLEETAEIRAVMALEDIEEGLSLALEREKVLVLNRKEVEAMVGRCTLLVKSGLKLREELFPEPQGPPEFFVAPIEIDGEKAILPKVTRAEAEHKASRIGGFEFQLILVPHYLFKYRCLLQSTSGGDRTAQGLVWVDAVSGSWMEMKPGFETVEDLDTPNFKMEPVIELSAATDIALEGIMGMNTRETEEVRHTGSATIFEKQKTFPVQNSIETEMAGILYIPMWNIEGSRGTMTINAVSASIVRESLYEE